MFIPIKAAAVSLLGLLAAGLPARADGQEDTGAFWVAGAERPLTTSELPWTAVLGPGSAIQRTFPIPSLGAVGVKIRYRVRGAPPTGLRIISGRQSLSRPWYGAPNAPGEVSALISPGELSSLRSGNPEAVFTLEFEGPGSSTVTLESWEVQAAEADDPRFDPRQAAGAAASFRTPRGTFDVGAGVRLLDAIASAPRPPILARLDRILGPWLPLDRAEARARAEEMSRTQRIKVRGFESTPRGPHNLFRSPPITAPSFVAGLHGMDPLAYFTYALRTQGAGAEVEGAAFALLREYFASGDEPFVSEPDPAALTPDVTARRLVHLLYWWTVAREQGPIPERLSLLAQIAWDAERLASPSLRARGGPETELRAGLALLLLRAVLPEFERGPSLAAATELRLADWLAERLRVTGGVETSPALATEILSDAAIVSALEPSPALRAALARTEAAQLESLARWLKPSGGFPLISAHATPRPIELGPLAPNCPSEDCRWQLSLGQDGRPPLELDRNFGDHVVVRERAPDPADWRDPIYLHLYAGFSRVEDKQHDDLTLWVAGRGTDWLVEAGGPRAVPGDLFFIQAGSASGHNVPLPIGAQPYALGVQGLGRVKVRRLIRSGAVTLVEAGHDLYPGHPITRTLIYVRPDLFVVHDRTVGAAVEQIFHFHPAKSVTIGDRAIAIRDPGGEALFLYPGPGEIRAARGRDEPPIQGFMFPLADTRVAAPTLEISGSGEQLASYFVFGKEQRFADRGAVRSALIAALVDAGLFEAAGLFRSELQSSRVASQSPLRTNSGSVKTSR